MKVNLVVASGVHQGRQIPIPGAQFLIGRDPQCQLRPASPAISKQHCGVYVRGGEVFVKDFGSTNGTTVNDEPIPVDTEVPVKSGDRLKLGPLDFTVQFVLPKPSDSTPLPTSLKSVPGGFGAAKVPAPPTPSQSAETKSAGSGVATKPQPIPAASSAGEDDDAAAMLLGMGEDEPSASDVPGGSTIMEMPNALTGTQPNPAAPGEEKKKGSSVPSREDTSNAANDILKRYLRRPK